MSTFVFLTILIGLFASASFLWATLKIRDVFHPLAYLMPMALFLYVFLPAELLHENLFSFSQFTAVELTKAQALNASCVLALAVGALIGGREADKPGLAPAILLPREINRVFGIAMGLGVVSLAAFAVNVNNVGGLFEAYSQEKGGGTADSGYVRDAVFWSVSALAAITVCLRYDGVRGRYLAAGAFFAAPMLIHGLLGGRRGPTFIAFSILAAVYYLGRNKRPSVLLFVSGGALLGLLLLLIVTFRDEFRFGSDLFYKPTSTLETMVDQLNTERSETVERTLGADEFIYGVDVVTRFSEGTTDRIFWGTRVLTIMFIRPIPSQFWPTKYQDVGMERYLINVGLGGVDQYSTVANGAAPGFAADLFAEFGWGAIAASLFIGWGYGRVWKNARWVGGIWLILYVLLMSLSIFFVIQTLEAMLYRLLLTAFPIVLLWRIMVFRKHDSRLRTSPALPIEALGR